MKQHILDKRLENACRDIKKLDEVKKLLENGANPNVKDNSDFFPLHHAAQRGITSIALELIKYGADVNAENWMNASPLHMAAGEQHINVVKLLLKNKANPNIQDTNGKTPLHWAVNYSSLWTDSPCSNYYLEVIRKLLKYGADPNIKDLENQTPLNTTKDKKIIGMLLLSKDSTQEDQKKGKYILKKEQEQLINKINEISSSLIEKRKKPLTKTEEKEEFLDIETSLEKSKTYFERKLNSIEKHLYNFSFLYYDIEKVSSSNSKQINTNKKQKEVERKENNKEELFQ